MHCLLACECNATAEANAALAGASSLGPDHVLVCVARARCAFARGEAGAARAALDAARQLGADAEVIGWIASLGDAAVRYGV